MQNYNDLFTIDGEDYVLVDGKIKPAVVFDDGSYVVVDDFELINGELVQTYVRLGGIDVDI